MRLIDADWVLEHIKPYELSDEDWSVTGGTAIRLIRNAINQAPTIDAVPVVRCEDCEYFRLNDENVPYCLSPFGLDDPEPNGFCNYGREKDAIEAWNRRAGEENKHGIETE